MFVKPKLCREVSMRASVQVCVCRCLSCFWDIRCEFAGCKRQVATVSFFSFVGAVVQPRASDRLPLCSIAAEAALQMRALKDSPLWLCDTGLVRTPLMAVQAVLLLGRMLLSSLVARLRRGGRMEMGGGGGFCDTADREKAAVGCCN